MQLNDHSLRQLDEAYLGRLGEGALRALSVKLLEDLKEAREQLNQNSQNSSRPPSREAPWEKPDTRPAERMEDESEAAGALDAETKRDEEKAAGKQLEASCAPKPPQAPRRAGKVEGAPGHGREAPERIDVIEFHAPACCAGCGASLQEREKAAYTGHYEVDFVRLEGGWQVRWIKHLWQEADCGCGLRTRAEPPRRVEDGIELGGFRLIGPGLATLIVALALRYRLSRARIREFLGDWLAVWLSVGSIHAAIEEAGALIAPVEVELIDAVQQSGLLAAGRNALARAGGEAGQLVAMGVYRHPCDAVLHQPPRPGIGQKPSGRL